VDDLLGHLEHVGSFLEAPACDPSATGEFTPSPEDEQRETLLITERPGTVIGPYKLLEQIGEGGMGLVFVAEQERPVKRRVALKIIKPGMDSRQVIARFEAERQALAMMDHQNIAKVHDGGTTPEGRPYFVMELVKGTPITGYCDTHRLTTHQRLELFLGLCRAVQHAHQKGIIHRDIKPSNVLVSVQDVTPVFRVIDFGIAKATGCQLTDKTVYTAFAQMVGTPLYMSPEQAGLSDQYVDTRSDVYALGVLLSELLTGTTPFDSETLKKAGYDEMRRMIREDEPPRPSARLSTMEQARLSTIAQQRGLEPHHLTGHLRGELDWIVMKALEKDRNRRYESASAFAADVQRYLDDEPVLACPPSAGYRLRKFARRNRSRLVAAGVFGLALLVAVAGIGWAVRDRTARQTKLANDLELALDRVDLFLEEGKHAQAVGAFEQAQMQVREAPPDPARDARLAGLQERLDAEARDRQFMARYEDIQLNVRSRVNVEESNFSYEAAIPEFLDALRQYGIAIGVAAPADAATCIQSRPEPIRGLLVATLYECRSRTPENDAETRQWLSAVIDAADNDAWRTQVRKALRDRDWKALEHLAREVDVQKQPTYLVLVLATSLPTTDRSARLELLRRTQRAYPADLWANEFLAEELTMTGQPAEAVRYFTAALALRPDNPGIYLNRGTFLLEIGEQDAAIADYRRALALAPQYAGVHLMLGRALAEKGELEAAIAELN